MDNALRRLINDRIKWDKRVSLADLNVSVEGGVVTVSGSVDTSFKKNAALEIITTTEGVWKIEDKIIVPGDYFRSDEEIEEILVGEISEMVKIGGEFIEVEVDEGIVRLSGEVLRPRLKAFAASMAWELSGVKDVFNDITVLYPSQYSPTYLIETDVILFQTTPLHGAS